MALKPGLHARLQSYGYFGEPNPPAFSFDITARAAYAEARRQGLVRGLRPLAALDRRDRSGANRSEEGDGDDEFVPLILAFQNSFPSSWNTLSAWGAGPDLRQTLSPFGGDIDALQHEKAVLGTIGQYQSTFRVKENESFAWRIFQYKPPKEIKLPLLTLPFGRWQLQIVANRPEIALRSAAWSQALEDQINALRLLEGYDDDIDNLRATAYDIYKTLPGGEGVKGGEFFEITVIPEPLGALNLFIDGEHERILIPSIMASGKDGIVYGETPLSIRGNGIGFAWQAGYPYHATTGSVRTPYKNWSGTASMGALETGGGVSAIAGVTAVALTNDVVDTIKGAIVLTATTTDRRRTPFIYSAQASVPGGARPGLSSAQTWDSDDHPFGAGGCIEEVTVEYEREMWRRSASITLADPEGAAFVALGTNYPALENRLATLSVDGQAIITRGLVSASGLSDMRRATSNLAGSVAKWAHTKGMPVLNDAWALLDEMEMQYSRIGDGLFVGEYLYRILRDCGFSAMFLTGINRTSGRRLPAARLNEKPCIRPPRRQRVGDWLRQIVDSVSRLRRQLEICAAVDRHPSRVLVSSGRID